MDHLVAKFLRRVQVVDIKCPEVRLEDDGEICFDWLESGCDLSISLNPSGRLAWAALVREVSSHGYFGIADEWPAEVAAAFEVLAS